MKKYSYVPIIVCVLALTAGNFVWQATANQDWVSAWERSFFQAVAGFAIAISQKYYYKI
jgi:hypothetical protein